MGEGKKERREKEGRGEVSIGKGRGEGRRKVGRVGGEGKKRGIDEERGSVQGKRGRR